MRVVVSDPTFFQDYKIRQLQATSIDPLLNALTEGVNQLYLTGRGDRSYFDIRGIHYYGFSAIRRAGRAAGHPAGDRLRLHLRAAGVRRRTRHPDELHQPARATTASFDPISPNAVNNWAVQRQQSPTRPRRSRANCLLRGIPGSYARLSAEADWQIPIHRPVRTGVHSVRLDARRRRRRSRSATSPASSNFIATGRLDRHPRHADGRPRIPLSLHRRSRAGAPRPSSRSASSSSARTRPTSANCRTRIPKAWCSTTPTCSRSTNSPAGTASRAAGAPMPACNTPPSSIAAAISTRCSASPTSCSASTRSRSAISPIPASAAASTSPLSDYVARMSVPAEQDLHLHVALPLRPGRLHACSAWRSKAARQFRPLDDSILYGDYAAQPQLGFLYRRDGILTSGAYKLSENWVVNGGVRYDIQAGKFARRASASAISTTASSCRSTTYTDFTYSGNVYVEPDRDAAVQPAHHRRDGIPVDRCRRRGAIGAERHDPGSPSRQDG